MIKTEIGFAKGETRTPVFMINLTLPRDKEVELNYGENYVLQSDLKRLFSTYSNTVHMY